MSLCRVTFRTLAHARVLGLAGVTTCVFVSYLRSVSVVRRAVVLALIALADLLAEAAVTSRSQGSQRSANFRFRRRQGSTTDPLRGLGEGSHFDAVQRVVDEHSARLG